MPRICAALFLFVPSSASADPVPAALAEVQGLIEREVADKKIPALSIAVVDGPRVVWQHGFGPARPTPETVYRVGSVSKLFTDLAVMQLVERGQLGLDEPVTNYLPDFRPTDSFGGPAITLRMLMAHRSGLVREPPVGNYFEPTEPPLAATVASLNDTTLVYEPGSRTKYSNAGIAAVGLVVERTAGVAFDRHLDAALLRPWGLTRSGFAPNEATRRHLAPAVMGTWHGRDFPAPTFELGMAPAGSMYAPVGDLARFASAVLAGGSGVVRRDSLAEMLRPQFAPPGTKSGVGLGFFIDQLDGRRKVGHGGAMYGFSTELAILPDDQLAVVVCSARDCTNGVTTRIADEALRAMLAVRANRSPPAIPPSEPVDRSEWVGWYASEFGHAEVSVRDGRTFLVAPPGYRSELRRVGGRIVTDGALDSGREITREGDVLNIGSRPFRRVKLPEPPPAPPPHWTGLIGEYGWDHNTLIVLERAGQLHALIEWHFLYPLEQESEDVYRFPKYGMYHDEKLVFHRDQNGRAVKVVAASIPFERRPDAGTTTFRIDPVKPIEELRRAALIAPPPPQRGEFATPDLVELVRREPTLKLDIRYATADNFLGTPVYSQARAFLQRPAADALIRAHRDLRADGLGIVIYDGYRPWYVTKIFRDAVPPRFHNFVADPNLGSRHNRGCAVDVGLFDSSGRTVDMPSGYDEFSDRAYPEYPGGSSRQRWHRDKLRRAVESHGFTVYDAEWWHFDYKDWKKYAVQNEPFEQLVEARP